MGLKSCPFCDSEDVWVSVSEYPGSRDGRACYAVFCQSCFACGPDVVNKDDVMARVQAADGWNKRGVEGRESGT